MFGFLMPYFLLYYCTVLRYGVLMTELILKKWGKDPIEKIHTHFYKHFIGLNRGATNIISRNEAGRLSFKSNISIADPCLLHSSQLANNGKPSFMLSFHEIMNLYTVTLLLINYSSLVYSHESQN